MTTVRAMVAADLERILPDNYRVIPYAKSVDRVEKGKPVLVLYRESVEQGATHSGLINQLTLWVLHPELAPGAVDDALDDSLDIVIAAIDESTLTVWTRAERGTFDDTYPSFKVTLETYSQKEL